MHLLRRELPCNKSAAVFIRRTGEQVAGTSSLVNGKKNMIFINGIRTHLSLYSLVGSYFNFQSMPTPTRQSVTWIMLVKPVSSRRETVLCSAMMLLIIVTPRLVLVFCCISVLH